MPSTHTLGRILALLTAASIGALVGYSGRECHSSTASCTPVLGQKSDDVMPKDVVDRARFGENLASTQQSIHVQLSDSFERGQRGPTLSARAATESDAPEWVPSADRAACTQAWFYRTFGYDHIPDFFIPGCDTPAVWDFETWAAQSNCASVTPPDELLVHTGWLGPLEGIHDELVALIDSFLATHATSGPLRARLTVWFMEGAPPDKNSPLRARYSTHDGFAVRFLSADLAALAMGTCLEGKPDFLNVNVSGSDWRTHHTMGPKEKADLVRLLLLHQYGGVWVDTDSVLNRTLFSQIFTQFCYSFCIRISSHVFCNQKKKIAQVSPLNPRCTRFFTLDHSKTKPSLSCLRAHCPYPQGTAS